MRSIFSARSVKLLSLAIFLSVVSVALLLVSIATDYWELSRFSDECVMSKNSSEVLVQNYSDFFAVQITHPSPSSPGSHIYKLHNLQAGIWRVCNMLSDSSQRQVYGERDRCLDFMADYPMIKQSLSQDTIFIIQMRNSATSSMILDLLMVTSAVITAVVGLASGQLICLTVTAVLYILTAFYTIMAAVVMHTKMATEMSTCSGIATLPDVMCDCHRIEAGWSLYMAWWAAGASALTCIAWMELTRELRCAATKYSLI